MKIAFLGQLGLPKLNHSDDSAVAARVEAVARELAAEGHQVTVFGTLPYLSAGNYHGIELRRYPSLDPTQPGGWTYLVFCLLYLLRHRFDVLHVHTFRAAFLLSRVPFLFRHTRLVWTVDELPKNRFEKLVAAGYRSAPVLPAGARRARSRRAYFTITTPSRAIQYRLLVEYGVKAIYIPDGYRLPVAPNIAVSTFGLKKNSYVVALVNATSPAALRLVARAHARSKTRKKLVVFQTEEGANKRLKKKFPLLVFLNSKFIILPPEPTPRLRRSVIAGAAAVILGDDSVSPATLLEAMDSGRAVVAVNKPAYQEIVGVTGRYFASQDSAELASILGDILSDPRQQAAWGKKAHKRAQRHFTWPRIVEEYQTLYAPLVRVVPLDSAYLVPTLSTR